MHKFSSGHLVFQFQDIENLVNISKDFPVLLVNIGQKLLRKKTLQGSHEFNSQVHNTLYIQKLREETLQKKQLHINVNWLFQIHLQNTKHDRRKRSKCK
jgi:hypothetical protein